MYPFVNFSQEYSIRKRSRNGQDIHLSERDQSAAVRQSQAPVPAVSRWYRSLLTRLTARCLRAAGQPLD